VGITRNVITEAREVPAAGILAAAIVAKKEKRTGIEMEKRKKNINYSCNNPYVRMLVMTVTVTVAVGVEILGVYVCVSVIFVCLSFPSSPPLFLYPSLHPPSPHIFFFPYL
jgi:hypothetical protein